MSCFLSFSCRIVWFWKMRFLIMTFKKVSLEVLQTLQFYLFITLGNFGKVHQKFHSLGWKGRNVTYNNYLLPTIATNWWTCHQSCKHFYIIGHGFKCNQNIIWGPMKAPCFNFLEFMLTKLMVIINLMVPTTLESLHGLLFFIKFPQCMLINGCCWIKIKIKIRWWIVVAYVWWWCLKINPSLIMWNQHLVDYRRCPLMLLLTPIFATYTNIGFQFKALKENGDGVLPTFGQWLSICWSSPQLHL